MIPTMPQRRRRRTRLDVTPCDVDVTPGIVVFWNDDHRSGRLHDVPMYLAMHWRKHSWATIVTEPVGAGAASNTAVDIAMVQGVATTAVLCESHDLRDTSTDPTIDREGRRPPPPAPLLPSPCSSATFSLYGSPQIRTTETVEPQYDSKSPLSGVAHRGDGDRTGSVRVRTCPNCSAPVASRRKWCSEACRLKAYRQAQTTVDQLGGVGHSGG
jgi:hypothetical protein